MYANRFYMKSPPWIQELLLSGRAAVRRTLREGRSMRVELDALLQSQHLDGHELEALQLRRLQELLCHAQQHVPFYRERFANLGFDARDFSRLAQLSALPVLEKTEVLAAGSSITSAVKSGPWFASTSSGTTGSFMTAHRDLQSIVRENAFIWRQLIWAGVKPGDRRAWLRGDKIVPSSTQSAPFWRINHADRLLMLSSYHLTVDRVASYVEALQEYDPVAIQAYPSALVFIAGVLESAGVKYGSASARPRKLRAIITSSETLLPSQRQLLERVFGCRVFDWYGSFERVAAIGTCEQGNYHLISDYGYAELQTTSHGEDVIGTGFDNFAMPLIRYRINDRIELEPASSAACSCGRAFPRVRSILGRGQDQLMGLDDHRVFMPANAFDDLPGLVAGQWRQSRPGHAVMLLQFSPGNAMSTQAVEAVARRYIGPRFELEIRLVDQIERTPAGKLPAVVHHKLASA